MGTNLITGPGQYQLRGLLMGRGTAYPVNGVDLGMPEVRDNDAGRPGDGVWHVGADELGPRPVVLELGTFRAVGAAVSSLADRASALAGAWLSPVRTGDVTFGMWLDGWAEARYLVGRPRRFEVSDERGRWRDGQVEALAMFLGRDPALYAATEETATATIAAAATSAQVTVTNDGNYRGLPVVEVAGPSRNPRITNDADGGRALRVDVDVQAGSVLAFDLDARTVKLDGVSAAANVRTDHEWWALLAGANTLTYARSSTALTGSSSTMTVRYHDAYLL